MNLQKLIILVVFLLMLPLGHLKAQFSNMIIRHSIQRSQLNNRINSQRMFNRMMRDNILENNGENTHGTPPTYFTKGPSTAIDDFVQQTGQNRASLEQSLLAFYQLMQHNGLYEQDYANGIALATVLNYLTYRGESYLDRKGVNLTASSMRQLFLEDQHFAKKTDREKQYEVENMAIAAMIAQALQRENAEQAKDMAGQLLQNTLSVEPASITFGSGGFYTIENLGQESPRLKQINTHFQRTDQCISCQQYAIDNGNTASYYQQQLWAFDRLQQQSGHATNDLLPMLTQCFSICYLIINNGYQLNEQQLQSARSLILEGFSNPEDAVLHLPDQQKQIIYETYAIGTAMLQQNYQQALQKQRNQGRGDYLEQAWELAQSSYDPNSLQKLQEKAATYLRNILYPVSLRDYILTEAGFVHR